MRRLLAFGIAWFSAYFSILLPSAFSGQPLVLPMDCAGILQGLALFSDGASAPYMISNGLRDASHEKAVKLLREIDEIFKKPFSWGVEQLIVVGDAERERLKALSPESSGILNEAIEILDQRNKDFIQRSPMAMGHLNKAHEVLIRWWVPDTSGNYPQILDEIVSEPRLAEGTFHFHADPTNVVTSVLTLSGATTFAEFSSAEPSNRRRHWVEEGKVISFYGMASGEPALSHSAASFIEAIVNGRLVVVVRQ